MLQSLGLGPPGRTRLLAAGAVLGLALILLANALGPRPAPPAVPSASGPAAAGPAAEGTTLATYEQLLSERLAALLGRVEGAGRVAVLVRLAAGEEAVYLQDSDQTVRRTSERDTQGGTRTIEEQSQNVRTVLTESGRGAGPVTRVLRAPQVEGVLVVAEGAGDPAVRQRLLRAVRALFPSLPAHQIEILKGR